jgi:hypothetical protein
MSEQIFISYRREESRWSARSLHGRLCRSFDPEQLFMDIDAIALGEDFVKAIENTVARCEVLVAVIGNNWLTSKDDRGDRRLDNPEDFVRMEIATALKREICVIPVLVDGALMPHPTDLPDDLKPLVRRNALRISDTSFDGDCQRLTAAIEQVLEKVVAERREREEKERPEHEPQSQPPSPVAPVAPSTPPAKPEADKPSAEISKVVYPVPPKTVEPGREKPQQLSSGGTAVKRPPKQVIVFLAIAAVLTIGGLIYHAIRPSPSPPPPQPVPTFASPSQFVIATPTPADIITEVPVEDIRSALTKSVAKQNNDPNADVYKQILINQGLDPAKIPGQSFATKVLEAYKLNPNKRPAIGKAVSKLAQ